MQNFVNVVTALASWQKFRESNVFTDEVTKTLISRNIFWRGGESFSTVVEITGILSNAFLAKIS